MFNPEKDHIFQKHLCKNTAELVQEKSIEKVSIPEAFLAPCKLSMMNFLLEILRTFSSLLFLQEHLYQMFDKVLSTPLYILSNSLILNITSSIIAHFIWEQVSSELPP